MTITSKVIAERGRRQGRELGIDPSRIPPGQYLTTKFPVLAYGRNPPVDLQPWSFWEESMAMERVTTTVDIHCVTRRSKLDTTWTGVRGRDLLERAGVQPEGRFVLAHSDGGFATNMPLELLDDGNPFEEQRHWF